MNPTGGLSASAVCDLAAASPAADAQGAASLCQENAQHAALAIGFGVAAAALAATGVVLLVTGRGGAEAPRGPWVQVGAWLGDGVRGARVEGTF